MTVEPETAPAKVAPVAERFRAPYQILLLLAAVLVVYYPALNAGFNYVDDSHIVQAYGINSTLTLREILLPGQSFYYRPIVALSFYLDGRLWEMAPAFMHLENVLVHAVNTVLVFLLGRRVLRGSAAASPALPCLAALLFALHPVNVESVSWVAGRTDPLAALFVLSASLFLVRTLEGGSRLFLHLSVLLMLAGALAKEVALFFLPVAVLMILCWPRPETEGGRRFRDALRECAPFLAVALAVTGALLSQLLLNPDSNAMLKLTRGKGVEFWPALLWALQAFGFYVKKLLAPLPLNFAIVTVDLYSSLAGGVAALLLLIFSRRRRCARFCFAAAFFLIVPALLAGVFKIAWTPVAERYLYLPSAFFALGVAGLGGSLSRPRPVTLALAALLSLAALFTVQRNLVWRDNLALYQDAVRQSPGFGMLRNQLALALLEQGREEEASRELETGRRLNSDPGFNFLFSYNLLLQRIKGKGPEEVRALVHQAVTDKARAEAKFLLLLRDVDVKRLYAASDAAERRSLTRDIIDTNEHLYAKQKDAVVLYYSGQLALRIGDRSAAAGYFRRAYQAAPEGAHFKDAARKLAQKLSQT